MTDSIRLSTPAERIGGLSLSVPGGVLTGSNNFEYDLEGGEFNSDEISIVCEFWPSFDWDEAVSRYFFDSPDIARYTIARVSSGVLQVRLGGVVVSGIPSLTYSPHWRIGERNIIVIYGKSTNTSAKLNDNLILDSNGTAWTSLKPDTFFIGSTNLSTGNFTGIIPSVKLIKRILVDKEITDIQNNTTYNYKNETLIYYPMTPATHSGTQTLDISGNNLHGTLVNAPTQNTNKGYTFNGANQHVSFPTQIFSNEFSLAAFIRPDVTTGATIFGHNLDTNKISLDSGNILVRVISSTDSTALAPGLTINFIGLTRDADNKIDLYVNNTKHRLFSDVAQLGDTIWNVLGKDEIPNRFKGSFMEARVFDQYLSPTQMFDMSLDRLGMRE